MTTTNKTKVTTEGKPAMRDNPQPPPVEAEIKKLRQEIGHNMLESPSVPKQGISQQRIPAWLSLLVVGCLVVAIMGGLMFSFRGGSPNEQGFSSIAALFNGDEASQANRVAQGNASSHAMPTMEPLVAPEPTPWPTPPIADSP